MSTQIIYVDPPGLPTARRASRPPDSERLRFRSRRAPDAEQDPDIDAPIGTRPRRVADMNERPRARSRPYDASADVAVDDTFSSAKHAPIIAPAAVVTARMKPRHAEFDDPDLEQSPQLKHAPVSAPIVVLTARLKPRRAEFEEPAIEEISQRRVRIFTMVVPSSPDVIVLLQPRAAVVSLAQRAATVNILAR